MWEGPHYPQHFKASPPKHSAPTPAKLHDRFLHAEALFALVMPAKTGVKPVRLFNTSGKCHQNGSQKPLSEKSSLPGHGFPSNASPLSTGHSGLLIATPSSPEGALVGVSRSDTQNPPLPPGWHLPQTPPRSPENPVDTEVATDEHPRCGKKETEAQASAPAQGYTRRGSDRGEGGAVPGCRTGGAVSPPSLPPHSVPRGRVAPGAPLRVTASSSRPRGRPVGTSPVLSPPHTPHSDSACHTHTHDPRPARGCPPLPLTEEPEADLEPDAEPALAGIVVRVEDGVDDVEAGHPERHFERRPGLLMGHPHLLLRGPHRRHEPLPHRGWAGLAVPGRRPGAGAEAATPPPPPGSLTTRPPPARVSRAGAGGGGSREASGRRCSRLAKAWLLLPPPPPPPAEPPS